MIAKTRRNLNHRLVDQHRNWIQVTGICFQAKALRFERDGPTTRKRIVKGRQAVGIEQLRRTGMLRVVPARPSPALPDFLPCLGEELFVGGILPRHQLLDEPKQPLALRGLCFRRRKLLRHRRWVIHQLRKEHCPRRSQWAPRPPQVQRRGVAVADRLLTGTFGIDLFQWQRHLDQLPATMDAGHCGSSPRLSNSVT
jgi:hypothetical protein